LSVGPFGLDEGRAIRQDEKGRSALHVRPPEAQYLVGRGIAMKNSAALHFTHRRKVEPPKADADAVPLFEVLASVANSISRNTMTDALILGTVVVVALATII
jgi:hypothetical protein